MEPCLCCSSFNWGKTKPIHILQAFVVAGGWDGSSRLSSVYTLLSGEPAWTRLANLPRTLSSARASVVGGKIRVTGGFSEQGSYRSEVMVKHAFNLENDIGIGWVWPIIINDQVLLLIRFLSMMETAGSKLETFTRQEDFTPSSPLGLRNCPAWQVEVSIG